MEAHVCRICLRFYGLFQICHILCISDKGPGAHQVSAVDIRSDPGNFFLLAKRQDFLFVFQQYKRFSCGFSCQGAVLFAENDLFFFRLVCVFIRVFKQSQFVFQFQDTHAGLIDQILGNLALSYKAAEVLAVNTCHHIDIDACLGGADSCLLTVCAVAVVNNLLDCRPVGNQNSVKSHLVTQDAAHQFLVSGCRNTVYRVEGSHYHRCSCIDAGFVGRQIEVTEGMLGKLYRIVVSSCCRSTIACEMLHTGSNFVRLLQIVSLESAYHSGTEQTVQIRILTGRLHDTAPSCIADQVGHRCEGYVKAGNGCLFCSNCRTLFGQLRFKRCALSQRNRENGLEAVDDIQHEQHRDVMRVLLHKILLDFL